MSGKNPKLFNSIAKLTGKNIPKKAEAEIWKRYGTECAVLVLDSTGFTRVTRSKGIIHFLRLFLSMKEAVAPVFKRHKCLAWRSSADNLFAEFATVDAAVAAAIDAHETVAAAKLMLDGKKPYRVCIGIGYGEVLNAEDKGVFGNEMNLACKLGEDTAKGGETLVSVNAYEHLADKDPYSFRKRRTVQSGNKIEFYAVT